MYSAYIGRRLLDLHNKDMGAERSPREFFDEVFFPLFFGDEQEDKRYLMWVNNSPFDQAYKLRAKQPLTGDVLQERLQQLHAKAAAIQEQDGSILLGSAALGVEAPTSSQVTNLSIPVTGHDVYLSWFGAAAGVGVEGGFSLLIDDDRVLRALLEGWGEYRRQMNATPHLKPHQIDTWNGHWLRHRFGEYYETWAQVPLDNWTKAKAGPKQIELQTAPWAQVMFALARECHDRPIPAYVYTFGNTNKTIGFIPLQLPRVHALIELYGRLFGEELTKLERRRIEELYETEFSFVRACRQGSIGLHALEPRKLRDYMPTGRGQTKLPKSPSGDEARITFSLYQTWIIAMLSNNEKLLDFADSTAKALREYTASDQRKKTTPKREVETALSAGSRRGFIEGLTTIIERDGSNAPQFDDLVAEIVKIPATDFPLLLTLIKFKYAVAESRA